MRPLLLFVVSQPFQDEFGETGLHAASGEGHVEVIIVLLQRGADVHILSKVGVAT